MDDLYLDLSPYYTDPIEEEFEEYLNEIYFLIPSISNFKGWDEKKVIKRGRPRGIGTKIMKRGVYISPHGNKK